MSEHHSQKYPFDEWQKKQCSYCRVMHPCEQVKFNFRDYQKGELDIKKRGCPWREATMTPLRHGRGIVAKPEGIGLGRLPDIKKDDEQ